jgi:hypothetical protein
MRCVSAGDARFLVIDSGTAIGVPSRGRGRALARRTAPRAPGRCERRGLDLRRRLTTPPWCRRQAGPARPRSEPVNCSSPSRRKGTSMAAPQPPSADPRGGVDLSDLPAEAWQLMRQFVEANATSLVLRELLGLGTGSGRIHVLFLLREQPMTLAHLAEAHGVDRPTPRSSWTSWSSSATRRSERIRPRLQKAAVLPP